MSKSSTASTSKPLPKQSAWSRGPPQSSAPSPRSQSPAPSTPTHPTHSRRPSALGQGVSIKDGVSVPRNNVGSVKQGSSVTFGSIDDASASISTSPTATPPTIKSEEVKSFGSVPATTGHVNGKASISSRPTLAPSTASSSSASTPPVSTPTTPSKPLMNKMDVSKLFQNPSSAPFSQPSSDTSSPAMRPSSLPPTSQTPSSQPPSQIPHSFTPFVPSGMRPPPSAGGPPRSPIYPRPMANGGGPRSQNGPNATPGQVNAGLASPRMGPGPHPGQPNTMPGTMQPPVQPQMMQWGGYYYSPPPPDQPYMYPPPPTWYAPPQAGHPPHHPLPPGPHGPPHPGITMSPRTQPPPLQGPGTPTQAHAVPAPHVPVPLPSHAHAPSSSVSSITSPPATPASATHPSTGRLNANSNAFVPSSRKPINIKTADGHEVKVESLAKPTGGPPATSTSNFRQNSPSATPPRRPASVRIETEEQKLKRIKAEAEERQKREQDEKERKEKERQRQEAEEKERKRKEAEEKERIRLEEVKERLRKEEEDKERLRKEEEKKERLRREAEEKERLKREEEERERVQKEEEEKERKRKAEEEKERKRKEEEERERQRRAEEEAAAAEAARLKEEAEKERLRQEEEAAKAAAEQEAQAQLNDTKEEGEIIEPEATKEEVSPNPPAPIKEDIKEKFKESLRINTSTVSSPLAEGHGRRRPGALDLSLTKNHVPAPLPSALATARNIDNINNVHYPEGIQSPKPELNTNARDGKFRYDREFLLQFMAICKEKPAMLPPLDAIGLEPVDQSSLSMTRGGSGRHRQGSSAVSRSGSIGLGFSPSQSFNKPGSASTFSMGNFATPKPSGDDRFHLTNAGRVVSAPGLPFNSSRASSMQRTPSQGGPGAPLSSNRTRSKRGDKRPDGGKGSQQQSHQSSFGSQNSGQLGLEPVAPLQASANRWDRKSIAAIDPDSPEVVERKVKSLLNKLTMEKFDSISDQIIDWANKSEKEKDGRTLIQVIKLVFEKATDEATWSEMYARLCRKMMEQISSKVQDDGIKNTEGKPIAGGQLFRKYLLNRCQEDFERGWVAKEAAVAAAANKAAQDQAVKAANDKHESEGSDDVVLYSAEYYTLQKAKRQGLGLIKFIGELFKLQMLTERIMHECVKKLLGNVENPEEEEIESLCKLLTTVGLLLDTQKARAHMDVYFSRMKELTKSQNVSPRMQFMLQDVIELRERKWVTRTAVAAPATIAQIHEAAAKEKAAQEKEAMHRQLSMSRGGSRRGGERGDYPQVGPDGWTLAGNSSTPRPPAKVGDLSNFGKISKGAPMTFRPSGVFAGKEGKRESLSRTSSSSNMFSMLQSEASAEPAATSAPKGAPEPLQRKRLILQPRTKPLEEPEPASATSAGPAETNETNDMSDEIAKKKIDEDVKEFFAVRSLEEAEVYFTGLPAAHHEKLIDKLAIKAIEAKEADAKLVAELLSYAISKSLCSASAVEKGLEPTAEILYDIAIDAPKAPSYFVSWVKGAQLDPESCSRLAAISSDNDQLISLLSS